MGGHNSLCEVLKWRKKALVVPRPGSSSEQGTRSRLFAERGLVRVLEPGDLCPGRLLPSGGNGALAAELDPPRRGRRTATGTTK